MFFRQTKQQGRQTPQQDVSALSDMIDKTLTKHQRDSAAIYMAVLVAFFAAQELLTRYFHADIDTLNAANGDIVEANISPGHVYSLFLRGVAAFTLVAAYPLLTLASLPVLARWNQLPLFVLPATNTVDLLQYNPAIIAAFKKLYRHRILLNALPKDANIVLQPKADSPFLSTRDFVRLVRLLKTKLALRDRQFESFLSGYYDSNATVHTLFSRDGDLAVSGIIKSHVPLEHLRKLQSIEKRTSTTPSTP